MHSNLVISHSKPSLHPTPELEKDQLLKSYANQKDSLREKAGYGDQN